MDLLKAIQSFCTRVQNTGEDVVELIVTENILSATIKDDTFEVSTLEYDKELNEWE